MKRISSLPIQMIAAGTIGFAGIYGFANPQTFSDIQAFVQSGHNLMSNECNIKGNVSISSSERIYHVPGQRYYAATKIDNRYGERWFCSEAEAIAAGWRRAGY